MSDPGEDVLVEVDCEECEGEGVHHDNSVCALCGGEGFVMVPRSKVEQEDLV